MTTIPWRRRVSALAVLVCPLLFAASPTGATQVAYVPLEELGSGAPVVVRGEVDEVRSFWNEGRTRILTEVIVRVAERYKGAPAGEVRIVQMGGEIDGVRMSVAGALTWQPGEDVVLFLEDSLPGRFRVSGFSQGRFDVQRDPRTGEEFVVQAAPGGAEMVGPARRAAGPVRLSLTSLLSRALPETGEGE
jgi:hypothetical protein